MNVLIFDNEDNYGQRLANLLVAVANDEIDVYVSKSIEEIKNCSFQKKYDLMLLSENVWQTYAKSNDDSNVIILKGSVLTDVDQNDRTIYKYQNAHKIYKKMMEIFLANNPKKVSIENSNLAELVLVYSPIGGSGKTTISNALAETLSKAGYRVLLTSFENYPSCSENKKGDLTELLKSIHLGEPINVKLRSMIKKAKYGSYNYISTVGDPKDLLIANTTDIISLVKEFRNCDIAEYIIIDSNSASDAWLEELLEEVDKVVLVILENRFATEKFLAFKKHTSFHKHFLDKTTFILNKAKEINVKTDLIRVPVMDGANCNEVISEIMRSVNLSQIV